MSLKLNKDTIRYLYNEMTSGKRFSHKADADEYAKEMNRVAKWLGLTDVWFVRNDNGIIAHNCEDLRKYIVRVTIST